MANQRDIVRNIKVVFDRASADRVEREMAAALQRAGAAGGKNFLRELQGTHDKLKAELLAMRGAGQIDDKEYKRRLSEVGKAYNTHLLGAMASARAAGQLTDREYIKLTRTLKNVGDTGAGAFARMRDSARNFLAGGLGRFIAAGVIVDQLRRANDAANRLDAANRTLAATAQITGTSFEFLRSTAEQANEKFNLGVPLANNLTIELAKLGSKAGDLGAVASGMQAFLDIGAARGLSAQQTLQAIQQAVLGIDEGTDKLFGKNPSTLYKEYAEKIGTSVGKLTDQQKALALVDAAMRDGSKVRGEYEKWLDTAAGRQFQLSVQIENTQATIGKALQPALMVVLPVISLAARAFGGFVEILTDFGRIVASGVLVAVYGLVKANAALARSQATVMEGAAWLADKAGADGLAGRIRARAEAIRADATAADAFATAAINKAREIGGPGKVGQAFGGRGSNTLVVTPPPSAPRTKTPEELKAEQAARDKAKLDAAFNRAGGLPTPGVVPINASIPLDPVRMVGDEHERQAKRVQNAWQEAMRIVEEEQQVAVDLISGLGKALAEGGIKGLGRYALAKSKENIASAIEAAAKGLVALASPFTAAKAPMYFLGAAKHTAAAAAWRVLGGAAGGGGAGGGGGGAGGGPSAGSANTKGAGSTEPRSEVHIHLVGPGWDALNPEVQKVVAGATKEAEERYGPNADVRLHRRRA